MCEINVNDENEIMCIINEILILILLMKMIMCE